VFYKKHKNLVNDYILKMIHNEKMYRFI